MLRVTVDITQGGSWKRLRTICIHNDGTGSKSRGNYNVWDAENPLKARIEDYPRQRLSVLRLVALACDGLCNEWKKKLGS